MPIDTVFSLLGTAKNVVCSIMDHIDKLKLSENVVTRIMKNLEYIELTIKKIEPHIKTDSDTKEILQFLDHLKNVSATCDSISKKNIVVKVVKAPSVLVTLHNIEAEIKAANSKLTLFISSNSLAQFCNITNSQSKVLNKIAVLQENDRVGVNIVLDKSIRRPPAPPGLTIQENKNKFIISWKACGGTVDDYEVCYDEQENRILSVGKVTTVDIGSPKVLPGNIYTMKVRGINKGGTGEWSNTVVGQFTKPFPQKPEISNVFLRSTIAVVTLKLPGAICSTESPVTHIEVSHVSATSKKWSNCELKIDPGSDTYQLMVRELQPNKKYNFRARTMNAEGWSEASERIEDTTLALPPKPAKPDPPTIKAHPPNKVAFVAKVPQNTCGKTSPIIEWKVTGYGADKEKVNKSYTVDENFLMKKNCFEESLFDIGIADLNPYQVHILQLFAKNENGWSDPSESFIICIAKPSTPINLRVSTKRTHSLIKIRWNPPNSSLTTHYEIVKRTKRDNYDEKKAITIPADKLSATFTKLKQNTYYYFKIRACNGSYVSSWSGQIEAHTRIHKGVKVALSPLAWVAGTLASPVITPITTGAVAGMIGSEASGKKAAVAAGTAGTVGGAVLGIVGAPLAGAGVAHMFVHGIDILSDQSDDESAVVIEES